MSHPLKLVAMLRDRVDLEQLPQIAVQQSPGVRYVLPHSFASQVVEIVDTVELALAGGNNLHSAHPASVQPLCN